MFSKTFLVDATILLVVTSTAKQIQVTFDALGGSVTPTNKEVTFADIYGSLPEPTKTGYTFVDWHLGSVSGSTITKDSTVTTASDHTLVAEWEANKYVVTFDANGGNVNPTTKTVTYDGLYGQLPTPTRTGYTFVAWHLTSTNGEVITEANKVITASNHTLVAEWEANEYTVTYDVNGGDALTPNSKTVTYDSAYGALPRPTKTGHTFVAWHLESTSGKIITDSSIVTTAYDHTLVAEWSVNEYTVTVHINKPHYLDLTKFPLYINDGPTNPVIETETITFVVKQHVRLAQLDRAFGYGPKGREFESSNARTQAVG